jgi:integrase
MANVRKRTLPSGLVRWQGSYVDAAGKRRAKLFGRRHDADAWLTKVKRDLQLGTHIPLSDSATVAEACATYIEHCRGRVERRERMTQKCFVLYEGLINNHILHADLGIGAIKIPKLSKSSIGEFRDRLRNAGVSVQVTRKVLGVLCRVLDLAISNDELATNQARHVVVIGTREEGTKKVQPPSKDVVRALLSAAPVKLRTIFMFAAATGVRAGELWALRWQHIDMAAKELLVETRVDAYGDEDLTKTDAGMRVVPLGDAMVTELKAWKLRSAYSKPDDLVFPNAVGKYISHTNFIHRDWHPLFADMAAAHKEDSSRPAAPPQFKWHHLRHFAVSCWIAAGAPPKTIQTWVGHSTLAMTMDIYGHLFKTDDHTRTMDDIAGALFS